MSSDLASEIAPETTPVWGTAVVIGGSVAGSFAARVLRDHFARVIVFDKDDLPDAPTARRGAMQGVHFHALLARGRMIANELFPGFVDELIAAGAAQTSHADSWVFQPYGWGPRRESAAQNVGASRLLIESVLRRRGRELPGVEVRPRTTVVDLLSTADGRHVAGVRVQPTDASPYDQVADLVVDCSGRTSPVERWLAARGYGEVPTTSVNAYWGYASRFYEIPDGVAPPVVGGFPIGAASDGPPATRGGFLLLQENGRWLVTLSGCAKDFPPGDDEGFLAFADTLAFPHIGQAIRQATPLSEISMWRNTVNKRRHLDQLTSWPDGFVAMADAVCSFNPVYGQGMSVAALEALDLRTELEHQRALSDDAEADTPPPLSGLGPRFQRRVAATLDDPWDAACRSDYGVPGVEGAEPPPGYVERLAYYERVVALGRDDVSVYERISAMSQLVIGPAWLDDPELRARVLADWDALGALVGRHDPIPTPAGSDPIMGT
jgi:2-polyprenyl-6-methoxyphenol hydroxylase-like FAD-dependent oxidoreductase